MARTLVALMVVVASMLGMIGCSGGAPATAAYQLTIVADESVKSGGVMPSIEVDVVGPSQADEASWEGRDVWAHFDKGVRTAPFIKSFAFSAVSPGPQVLAKTDPIWKDQWLGPSRTRKLFVFVRNNALREPKGAENANWRRAVSIEEKAWKSDRLRITIQRDVVVITEEPSVTK
jgi:hypothetical protein